MIIINHTLSFVPEIEQEAILWMKQTYITLLQACPVTNKVLFCKVIADADIPDSYALQIHFNETESHTIFCNKHETEFLQALALKFTNNFGIFSSTLEEV